MTRERMSGVDTAWLRMDGPGNLMMIVGVEVLESPIGYDQLCERLQERLLRFDRFRQRVEPDVTGYWWVDDPDFDISRHVVRVKLRGRAGEPQLKALAARLASEPLDPAHPLWQFHLVEHYEGGSAVVVRIHHCIADGIALVGVLLSLTDAVAQGAGRSAHADAKVKREEGTEHDVEALLGGMFEPLTRGAVHAAEAAGVTLARSVEIAGEVATDSRARSALASIGTQVVTDALRIALMSEDSPTRLKGKPSGRKAVAWNDPMRLDEVKLVCKVLEVSVNDVLLSGVAGALHRYLERHGEYTQGKEIRAMVPVNLRGADEPASLGNRFGLVPLTLPVGIANPLERLYEVRRRMRELKDGYQAPLAFALLSAIGHAPRQVQGLILEYLASKGTAVMTNVPGPRQPIELFGIAMSRMMFWVPQSGDIGVGVSILSYNGAVQFGLMTDVAMCPDPQAIVDLFEPEFERLVLTLSMLPRELVDSGLVDAYELEQRLLGAPVRGRRTAGAKRARSSERTGARASPRRERGQARAGTSDALA
jgi:diacylglycerol O-acyltransferase